MSPHGAVIWLLAGATWVALLVPSAVVLIRRRRARAVCITDVQPAASPRPARPALADYASDRPASGQAWAVETDPDPDDPGGR